MMDEECDSSREIYWEAGNCSLSYDVAGRDLTRTQHFCETTELKFVWSLIFLIITDCTSQAVQREKQLEVKLLDESNSNVTLSLFLNLI